MGEQKYDFDGAHALVRFTVRVAGLTDVEGRFTDIDAAISYDESDLTKSSVTALIHAASIDTAEKERDDHLRSPDFFDAVKFPVIRYQSKRVEKRGSSWVAVGDLTIHGVTHEIELPFQSIQLKHKDPFGNDRIGCEAHATIKRSDYGIPGPSFWGSVISDDVDILLRVSARIYNWDDITPKPTAGKKSLIADLLARLESGDQQAIETIASLKADPNSEYDLREWQIHALGRKLFQHGKFKEAREVFGKYAEIYPKSATAADDLAETCEAAGDRKRAMTLFEQSSRLDPFDANAIEHLRTLGH